MNTLMTLPEKVAAKIMPVEDGCWLWTASLRLNGYGQMQWDGKNHGAHRLVYELLVGPIPPGLEVDHLCRVRSCVNPDHMEPVTHQENSARGLRGRLSTPKTHCPRNHPYSRENLYVHPTSGAPVCRACKKARR